MADNIVYFEQMTAQDKEWLALHLLPCDIHAGEALAEKIVYRALDTRPPGLAQGYHAYMVIFENDEVEMVVCDHFEACDAITSMLVKLIAEFRGPNMIVDGCDILDMAHAHLELDMELDMELNMELDSPPDDHHDEVILSLDDLPFLLGGENYVQQQDATRIHTTLQHGSPATSPQSATSPQLPQHSTDDLLPVKDNSLDVQAQHGAGRLQQQQQQQQQPGHEGQWCSRSEAAAAELRSSKRRRLVVTQSHCSGRRKRVSLRPARLNDYDVQVI